MGTRTGFGLALVGLLASAGVVAAADSAPPRLALALSGGGARGFAHIGVLRGLETCGIPVDAIVGTSMGAFVGGLYALGYTTDELAELALGEDWTAVFLGRGPSATPAPRRLDADWALFSLTLDRNGLRLPVGLFETKELDALLLRLTLAAATEDTEFDQFARPFRVIATDVETGTAVLLDRGSLKQALLASMAVPGAFPPVLRDGRLLFDGGVADNLPVEVARTFGAPVVVAVDTSSPLRTRDELTSFAEILDQAVSFDIRRRRHQAAAEADVLIVPNIGRHSSTSFDVAGLADLITCGEEAVASVCPELHARFGGSVATRELAPRRTSVRVHELAVVGLEGRFEGAVRRAFGPVADGDTMDFAMIDKRLRDVRGIDGVARVDLTLANVAGVGDRVDLHLRVTPRPPLRLRLGTRFDDKRGALGRASLTWAAGLGWVNEVRLVGTAGSTPDASLELVQNRWLGRPARLLIRGEIRDDFDRSVRNGEDLGRLEIASRTIAIEPSSRFGRSIHAALGYRASWVRSRDHAVSESAEPERAETLAGLSGSVTYDSRVADSWPRAGLQLAARIDSGLRPLGSDRGYAVVDLGARFVRRVGEHAALDGWGRLAAAVDGPLPLFEQRVVGGNDLLPGYQRDQFRDDRLALAGLGLQRQVFELPTAIGSVVTAGLHLAAGTADRGPRATTAGGRLLYGVGLTAAADTVLGPFDLSYGINRDGHDRWTLSVGPRF